MELEQSRSARIKVSPFLADTPAKRLDNLYDLHLRGYDEPGYVAAMTDVSLEQANDAIAGVYDPDNALIVLVATADQVAEGSAALGEVTILPFTEVE